MNVDREQPQDSDDDPARTFVASSLDPLPSLQYINGAFALLDESTAQPANVSRQNYTMDPRPFYINAEITCVDCSKPFLFSADEQRVWYEEYRLFVDIWPNRCPECRRRNRNLKKLRQQYDESITAALASRDVDAKRAVVAIIESLVETGSEIPAKLRERRDLLLRQIRGLQPADRNLPE